jgi:hypothetical protein
MKSMKIGTFILMYCFVLSVFGQKELPQNYKRFDQRFIHFGFMLGWNTASFSTYQSSDAFSQYRLKSLVTNSQPGGQVGIYPNIIFSRKSDDLHLHEYAFR